VRPAPNDMGDLRLPCENPEAICGGSFCIGGSNNGLRFIDALRPSVDTSTVNSA
jgi:hypothetical protein